MMSLMMSSRSISTSPGKSAAPILAGAPQPAADIDSALLKTLQHLHGLDPDVLLIIFRLMAEPFGFWHELSKPQQLSGPDWQNPFTYSWQGKDP